MSKKYCYLARKRKSHRYFEATTTCHRGRPGNFTTCWLCLLNTGWTRKRQKADSAKKKSADKS